MTHFDNRQFRPKSLVLETLKNIGEFAVFAGAGVGLIVGTTEMADKMKPATPPRYDPNASLVDNTVTPDTDALASGQSFGAEAAKQKETPERRFTKAIAGIFALTHNEKKIPTEN